jgi:hypothetical protein
MHSFTTRGAVAAATLIILAACAGPSPTDPVDNALAPTEADLSRADQGKAGKVDICHVQGNGAYHLINVSANAQPAHMAHGDGLPGEDHPEMGAFFLSDTCEVVEASEETCTDAYADTDACEPYGEGDSDGNTVGEIGGDDSDDGFDGFGGLGL